ncbi:MAG: hypothetical protein EZS28_019159 [Streblomastix strix]|uniref:Ketosynthase family 3 (KS3) domain-containing protein n=1 Tax=Streblomastix strix TaxID=222440 RepID=A0A5J4VRT5_9EUKA|nr:MAG: hypothetical protein EZS28_019159 [Streblomastix strix]
MFPYKVNYVEAHGIGTLVGDLIECQSIARILDIDREKGRHVVIGSVKSNVGHLEPVTGIVSLIKFAFAMKYYLIPLTVPVHILNPRIDMKAFKLKIATQQQPFPNSYNKNKHRTAHDQAIFACVAYNKKYAVEHLRQVASSNNTEGGVKSSIEQVCVFSFKVSVSFTPVQKDGIVSRSGQTSSYNVILSSRTIPSGKFQTHCTGIIELEQNIIQHEKIAPQLAQGISPDINLSVPNDAFQKIDMNLIRQLCLHEIAADNFYDELWKDGLELGRELRLARKIWIYNPDRQLISLGLIELNHETQSDELERRGWMYPPMMDSCLQSGLSARGWHGALFSIEAH